MADNAENEVETPQLSDSTPLTEQSVSADENMPRRSSRQNIFRGFMSDGTNRRGRNWFRGRNSDFSSR